MGILTPIYGLVLLLVLPIIALYFLKPKSEKKIIASQFLWKKTVDSINLQKIDKRLIRNWLFYLQLMAIFLGALFLMQPYMKQGSLVSKDAIVIIDTSRTLSTLEGEASRLEKNKMAAVELLQGFKGGQMMVYTLGEELTLAYKGTSRSQAIEKIGAITQKEVSLNPKALKVLIQSYEGMDEEIGFFIFSDHLLSESPMVQHYLSTGGENSVSVDSISHRRGQEEDYLQIVITNKVTRPVAGDLLIYGDERLLKIEEISLLSEEDRRLSMDIPGHYKGYRVEWSGQDDYVLDNTYYYGVGQVTTKKILLAGEDNRFLEEAMMILPNVELYKTDLTEVRAGYDLYVYNGVLPEKLPEKGSLFFVNPKGQAPYLEMGSSYKEGTISFLKEDPIWRHVKLDFNVREVTTLNSVIGPGLMHINGEPIIAKGQVMGRPAVVVGFDLLASDFPIRIGFPVFIHNTANYLLGQVSRVQNNSQLGQTLTFYGDPRADDRVLKGMDQVIALEDAALVEVKPEKSGFYVLAERDGDTLIKESVLAFNVSREEAGVEALEQGLSPSILTAETLGHRPLKWVVLLLLLLVILTEWWVYNHGY